MGKKSSILIVEDDPCVAGFLQSVLTDEGCEVTLANDGQALRDRLASSPFDAVVLDIGLPGSESGLALAQSAAEHGCGVVLITGHHHLRDELVHSGYRYLLKPFRIEALLRAIEEAIDKSRAASRRGGKAAT